MRLKKIERKVYLTIHLLPGRNFKYMLNKWICYYKMNLFSAISILLFPADSRNFSIFKFLSIFL